MIKDTFNSFTNNINQKLKNPFLGTFIIVWTIRNWKFVYSLFYFDSTYSLDDRIEKIKTFFLGYDIYEILITIGVSFLILIITYILLNLSRLIVNFFDKMITPKVYELSDKSSVVLKSIHVETKNHINLLESKIQNERELRLKAQTENEQLEKRIKELLSSKSTLTDKSSNSNGSDKVNLIINKLNKENNLKIFENIASHILNENPLKRDEEFIKTFTTMGLITRGNSFNTERSFFILTEKGKEVHEAILFSEQK